MLAIVLTKASKDPTKGVIWLSFINLKERQFLLFETL